MGDCSEKLGLKFRLELVFTGSGWSWFDSLKVRFGWDSKMLGSFDFYSFKAFQARSRLFF